MTDDHDDLRAFLLVLRQAMLMVVAYIDRRYNLERKTGK